MNLESGSKCSLQLAHENFARFSGNFCEFKSVFTATKAGAASHAGPIATGCLSEASWGACALRPPDAVRHSGREIALCRLKRKILDAEVEIQRHISLSGEEICLESLKKT